MIVSLTTTEISVGSVSLCKKIFASSLGWLVGNNTEDFTVDISRFKDWLTCQGWEKLVS